MPFASALVERVDITAPRMRRDLNALFQLIKAHALLHQQTRERDDEDRIVATITDYAAVHALVHQIYAENVEQAVPTEVRELVQAVQQMGRTATQTMTASRSRRSSRSSPARARPSTGPRSSAGSSARLAPDC